MSLVAIPGTSDLGSLVQGVSSEPLRSAGFRGVDGVSHDSDDGHQGED